MKDELSGTLNNFSYSQSDTEMSHKFVIKYKNGDVVLAALKGEIDVLIHQCNCFNNMGAGIAPKIARAFPDAKLKDQATVRGDINKLGTYTVSHKNSNCSVVNVYGQYHWRKRKDGKINTDYKALEEALTTLGDRLRKYKPDAKVGLPKIGCGLGGGDWTTVEKILNKCLFDLDVTVFTL